MCIRDRYRIAVTSAVAAWTNYVQRLGGGETGDRAVLCRTVPCDEGNRTPCWLAVVVDEFKPIRQLGYRTLPDVRPVPVT